MKDRKSSESLSLSTPFTERQQLHFCKYEDLMCAYVPLGTDVRIGHAITLSHRPFSLRTVLTVTSRSRRSSSPSSAPAHAPTPSPTSTTPSSSTSSATSSRPRTHSRLWVRSEGFIISPSQALDATHTYKEKIDKDMILYV